MAKKKKGNKNKNQTPIKRELLFAEDMQEYCLIDKLLGDRRVNLTLTDGTNQMGIIPGRFRKRCWMKPGDLVLASQREFQDGKLDIVYKYNSDEKKRLQQLDEIPRSFINTGEDEVDCVFDFGTSYDQEEKVDIDAI